MEKMMRYQNLYIILTEVEEGGCGYLRESKLFSGKMNDPLEE